VCTAVETDLVKTHLLGPYAVSTGKVTDVSEERTAPISGSRLRNYLQGGMT
jgi:hypothetical protein